MGTAIAQNPNKIKIALTGIGHARMHIWSGGKEKGEFRPSHGFSSWGVSGSGAFVGVGVLVTVGVGVLVGDGVIVDELPVSQNGRSEKL